MTQTENNNFSLKKAFLSVLFYFFKKGWPSKEADLRNTQLYKDAQQFYEDSP